MDRIRILIADDHPVFRYGLRALLQAEPAAEVVGEAMTGNEVIALAASLQPDIILMDLNMPGINGIEAAREISKIQPHISVLLCSMFLDSHLARLARNAGITGALSKSNVGQIVSGIEALLQGKEFFASQI